MEASNTKVVILCGGKGTRLGNLTELLPKPLVPIGERPIIWHIMKYYSTYGYRNFILCLGYKGDKIRDFFLHYPEYVQDVTVHLGQRTVTHHDGEIDDWNVSLIDTGEETNTGRRLYNVRNHLVRDPYFMLTYGDGLSDINLDALLAFHQHTDPTIVGTFAGVREWSKYGKVKTNAQGVAYSFEEKPLLDDRINGGFMVLNRAFLDNPLLHEDEGLERILKDYSEKKKMAVYHHDGFWYSMDEPREYEHLNALWQKGEAPWKRWRQQ